MCHAIWAGLDSINEFINECICFPAFRALLQIRAVRKKPGALSPVSFSPVLAQTMDHDEHSVRYTFFTSCASYLTALTVKKIIWNLYYNVKIKNKSTFLFYCDFLQGTDSVPPGFEPISLLEALNGLHSVSPAIPSAPLYDDINFSGGLGGDNRQLSSPEHLSDGSLQKGKVSKSPDR